jgi:hypothetical protein
MRNLLHWIGAAVDTQPFYSEEIRMVRFTIAIWCFRLPGVPRLG